MRLVLDLNKARKGSVKAGHKYTDRRPDGKGGWVYTYDEPTSPHQAAHAEPTPAAHQAPANDPHDPTAWRLEGRHDWIKRLRTAAERRAARLASFERYACQLDHEEGLIVLPSGHVLEHRVGGRDFVTWDVSFMGFPGYVMTHNHPTGKSFSPEDIQFALETRLREIRAVGTRFRYSFKPPDRVVTDWEYAGMRVLMEEIDEDVREEFNRAIREGRMTAEQANTDHWHEVWTRFAPQIGATYTREYWPDADDTTPLGAVKAKPKAQS